MESQGTAISETENTEDLPQKKTICNLRDCKFVTVSDCPDHGTAKLRLLIQKRNIRGPVVRTPQISAGK